MRESLAAETTLDTMATTVDMTVDSTVGMVLMMDMTVDMAAGKSKCQINPQKCMKCFDLQQMLQS